jgi:hypothetical protein
MVFTSAILLFSDNTVIPEKHRSGLAGQSHGWYPVEKYLGV